MKKIWKNDIPSSEITPEPLYKSRREFMKYAALAGAGALLAACGVTPDPNDLENSNVDAGTDSTTVLKDELGDPANTYKQIANYNNYYEFTVDKEQVAPMAADFPTSPWQVEVSGLVNRPKTYAIEDILKFPQEERIYRLRCVEGWSMVIPWLGFPLAKLLNEVEPMGSAKYVKFTSIYDPDNMPGQRSSFYPYPYTEGLRLDEALNDLTLMVTGLYGKTIPTQNGAPFRLAVPWKYGFKSAKAIVKIELVEEMPTTFWSTIAPDEYGFYANVNPEVSHPRWSQATERRIGESGRRDTLLFNGYAGQVSSLYTGLDLRKNY